jgi:hypothetical protein
MFRDKFRKRIALALSTELYIQPWVFFFRLLLGKMSSDGQELGVDPTKHSLRGDGDPGDGIRPPAIFGKLGLKMPTFFEVQGLHLSNG